MNNTTEKAFIYDIQHYCIHDGPGIRTVVFFKGCQLSCGWCANPESQRTEKEIGFFRSKCRMCGDCLNVCKQHALDLNAENRIDRSACTLCGDCEDTCLHNAYRIFGETITCEEAIKQVVKDRPFYRKSGGGVTVSGGEATMQTDALVSFLKELKQMGIHTALETNGCFSAENRTKLVSCTDLFLYDIKHMDSAKHKQYTGVNNELILENIYKLAVDYGSEVIMRVPLIPGFNDDEDNMKATARLGKELTEKGRLRGVHLLGFHNMATGKYEALQRNYDYRETPGYTDEQLNRFAEYFKSEYVSVQIGG